MSARLTSPPLPASFAALYAEHYAFMWRCARRLGVAPSEVEDVVQDSFVVALRRYDEFDHDAAGQVSSWLFAILRNVARNRGRGERRRQARVEAYAASPRIEFTSAESGTQAELARALLDEFLDTLDADKREAFILAELEGMTGPELARAIGLNVNTANSRLRAARKAFHRHFDEPRATLGGLRRGARSERPDAGARARSLPAIAIAAGYELGPSAGLVSAGVSLLSSKLLAGLIAAGSLIGAGLIVTAEPEPAPDHAIQSASPASASLARTRPEPTPSAAVATTDTPRPAPEPRASAPRPASRPKAAATSEPEASGLAKLGRARQALLAGDPQATLALLDALDVDPGLDGRRVALEVAANCELGRVDAARELAATWRARHPSDPVAAQLVDVCKQLP